MGNLQIPNQSELHVSGSSRRGNEAETMKTSRICLLTSAATAHWHRNTTLCFLLAGLLPCSADALDHRGSQFIPIRFFSDFQNEPGSNQSERVLTSHKITSDISFNELVISWSAELRTNEHLKIEVRAVYPSRMTKYYTMGLWAVDPAIHPRESVLHQKDGDGDVKTDTLLLKDPCDTVQIRLTCCGYPQLKLIGLSFIDSTVSPPVLTPNRAAWGKTIPVPERSQMAYPNGGGLCSPTTVSMIMSYWAKHLDRSDLDQDVPVIVKQVYDPNWEGTGNWPFNTACAGSYRGMRGYVARLSDISELEDWIAVNIPVGLSVCYNKLRGRSGPPSGHLVVCVGFTEEGDVIINDPGTSRNVRKFSLAKM
jgi:hypothetical protein